MDHFSGHGGVSRAVEAMGFRAKFWDIKQGSSHDLICKAVVDRIIREIRRGRVLSCMMASVCTSYSVARDRAKVIHNRRYPWGIPFNQLTEKEVASICLGNACFRSCVRITKALDKHKVRYILENPDTSKAWSLPPLREQLSQPWTKYTKAEFCCFNTPWRKRTGFMSGH